MELSRRDYVEQASQFSIGITGKIASGSSAHTGTSVE